ncbi:hypothetical protein [Caloramator proteoclasticus]|uniref:Uncharacterized protein n=1 Tax=Caloramator proteoclasticus DSM 10124 TaxID=1121262 RepID=A0A1M5AA13_9CLOT|nr:hypothetical protein [Caloramator proteoclasticus]SHF26712.1 hypothetical protein SAMN02746091_02135 [Caloramator proteoclasticus DSM 10124]
MHTRGLYDLERQYLFKRFIFILVFIIIFALFLFIKPKNDYTAFEKSLKEKDYKALYNMIMNKDFTYQVFEEYIKYNFGDEINIKEKQKTEDGYVLKVNSKTGDKILKIKKEKNKLYWDFNDYVYNWTLQVPLYSSVEVCGQIYENKNGFVTIEKIPFASYNVKIKLKGCEDYENRILAGQKVEVKLELAKDVIDKCKEAIYDFLKFKENAIENKKITEVQCLYTDSGLYKEVLNEIEWLKTVDYKYYKKLIDWKVVSAKLKHSGVIEIDVKEDWEVKIITDENESTNINTQYNRYYVEMGENYKIVQINTIK